MIIFLYIILVCYVPLVQNFLPVIDLGGGLPDIDLSRVLFILLFITVMLLVAAKRIRLPIFHQWIVVLILLFGYAFASIAWSERDYSIANIQIILDSYFTPILVAILGLSLFQDDKNIKRFMFHMSIVLISLAIIAVYQYTISPKVVKSVGMLDIRATGTLGNANILAIYFVLNIPAFLYMFDKGLITKKRLSLMSFFIILGIFTTLSRKGIITTFLSPIIYYFLTKRYKRVFGLVAFSAVCLIILMSYTLMSQRLNEDELSTQFKGRGNMVMAGFRMLEKNLFFGIGYEGYYDNFGKYVPGVPRTMKYSAHNIFIEALTNYGLLGFSLFLMIFVIPLKRAVSSINKRSQDSDLSQRGTMCIATLVPFMISGFFSGGLFAEKPIIYLLYTYLTFFLSANILVKDFVAEEQ